MGGSSVFFSIRPGESMGYCGHYEGLRDSRARAFSYNKRTMDRAMGPFLALVAVPRINKLRVLNTLDSSTPAASTIFFIINQLQTL